MRPCPACGRRIQDAAQRCHYCNAPVPHMRRADRAAISPAGTPTEAPSTLRVGTAVVIGLVIALIVGVILALLG